MLLQIIKDGVEMVPNKEESISLFELISKGGWTMFPLFLLSVGAVYIFVDRFLVIMKASKDPGAFMETIRDKMLKGDVSGALATCEQFDSPFARMIGKGVSRIGNPLKNIAESVENVGTIEIFKLEKNLSVLATISGAAPMIGFFGTVIGMIRAFMSMAEAEAAVSPKLLSAGIYEAMITTAAGLFVGIIAYVGYNYLVAKVEKTVHNMEAASIDFIDLLQEPTSE